MRKALYRLIVASCALLPFAAAQDSPPVAQALNKPAKPESRPNRPAPDFDLPVFDGGRFVLSEAWSEGYVLLVFIRGMW